MRNLSAALVCLIAMCAEAAAGPEAGRLLARVESHSSAGSVGLRERIQHISGDLLGRPYRLDPLGEGAGAGIDADPPFTLAAFDCITFVETVLALALARDADESLAILQRIRYGQREPHFAARTHLPTLDWLPNLVAQGYARNITAERFGGAALGTIDVRLNRQDVLRRLARGHALAAAPPDWREQRLNFLKASATAQLAHIESGSILLVVHPQARALRRAGIGEAISHAGFAVRESGTLMLRSATPLRPASVRDRPLADVMRKLPGDGAGLVVLEPVPR